MYDLLIRNAQLLDGTGQPAYKGDIAVEQGRIAAIGDLSAATAKHLDVSPPRRTQKIDHVLKVLYVAALLGRNCYPMHIFLDCGIYYLFYTAIVTKVNNFSTM